MGLYGLLRGYLILLYVDVVHTSQETHLWTSTACYGGIFNLLYIDYVRTSQETHIWISTVCNWNCFALLYLFTTVWGTT
jgi:hypothetical protein